MFDNVGSKIKALASFFCWGGIIASVIGGIIVITLDEDLVWTGLAVIIIGSLLSWVSSFVLYGFGELVVNSAIIAGKEGKIVVGGQSGNAGICVFGKCGGAGKVGRADVRGAGGPYGRAAGKNGRESGRKRRGGNARAE